MSDLWNDLITRLEPFAPDPPAHYWVGGDHDCGENYCRSCCDAEVKRIRTAKPELTEDDVFRDGGWEAHEEDSPTYCATCGCLTSYTLTGAGIADELAHFEEFPLSQTAGPIPTEAVYEVLRMLESSVPDAEDSPRVLAIAADALSALHVDANSSRARGGQGG